MPTTTLITVNMVDNELYIIASNARESTELCHLKQGYTQSANNSFNPGAILEPGEYDFTLIGINWGGDGAFQVVFKTDEKDETFLFNPSTASPARPINKVGVVWDMTVKRTVTTP